jgi:endonuclease/exonuclease/phosphatase family metal-dependent hydrolase
LDECVDPTLPKAEATDRSTDDGPRFYDGSYGIGLLSSRPLKATDRLDLESAHHPRGVLYAEIEVGAAPLHVFCTHLTPILRGVPHPNGGSWSSEQSRQVDAMLAFIERKAGNQPVLVLGDLNTGPGLDGIKARTPEHYARFVRAGFSNPYLDAAEPRCSFCYDNPVIGGSGAGLLIDHVLTRRFNGSVSARRFLDRPLELAVRGRKQPSALSDHYGIVAELVAASD